MSTPAIRFDRISKKFVMYHERPRSFQEMVVNLFRHGRREELWALRDVSFTVQRGEVREEFGVFYIPSRWEHHSETTANWEYNEIRYIPNSL